METINVGQIIKPHGVKGELKVYSSSDFIMERLKRNSTVFLRLNGKLTEKKVISSRMQNEIVLVKFEGIDSMNDAELWRNAEILVDKSKIPALKDGFYFFQLKGLDAYSLENEKIGVVIDVEETFANRNLRIRKEDGNEVLVPYVKAFVQEVLLEENKIMIHVIEGLL